MARATVQALQRLRASGRKVLLVTGETKEDLAEFPHLELFDLVVAENGAVLHDPATGLEESLAGPPPPALLRELRRNGVDPLKSGRVVVSTEYSQEDAVTAALRELDIGWRLIRNRHDLILLPEPLSKATGLAAALKKLALSPHQVIGVGDAENDIALLESCGLGVAVANAAPVLKAHADLVMTRGAGAGIVELIGLILGENLALASAG